MRIVFRARALRHLREIESFISRDSLGAAGRLMLRIEGAIGRIAEHPYSAPAGIVAGTRQLSLSGTPYLIVYRVGETEITVLAILHASRSART